MLLNNQWINDEIKWKIKEIPWDKQKCKYNIPYLMGCRKSSSKRKIHNNECLVWEIKNPHINNISLPLKKLEKEQTMPKLVERRKWQRTRINILEKNTI